MTWFYFLLLVFINLSSHHKSQGLEQADSKCVFGFGTCGTIPGLQNDLPVPCKYDGPPQQISNRTLLESLDKICPSLGVLNNKSATLCCDQFQIEAFVDNIKQVLPYIGQCPSCLINFSRFFCDLVCNPNQSKFAKVTKSKPFGNDTHDRRDAVEEINYSINESFVEGLFDSCKDVISTAAQTKALDIICGGECNPHAWVEYLGRAGVSPYDIRYTYIPETFDDTSIIPCYESVSDRYPHLKELYPDRCSFNDCPYNATPPPPKPNNNNNPDDTPVILESVGIYILVTFLFILLAALISNLFDSCFDHRLIDNVLKDLFRKWALFCTHYATLIILLGLAIVTLSCVGLTKLQILTDPVNLWSQKTSQAHQEKVYFENTFGPFYRAEQIIIYPKESNPSWYNFTRPDNVTEVFSNVFELGFLRSALELQKKILKFTVKYNNNHIKLEDICLKPVKENTCAIQSPLDWFGGEEKNFNSTNNHYLLHFSNCVKQNFLPKDKDYYADNHNDLPCLGPYGGPVKQYLALAGYPNNEYLRATALVISIPVENKPKEDNNRKAKAWESEFINLLSNYNDTNLKLSFYSERSIEDEIERQSHSDVFTIAISYLVMFAYVAISLGRTTSLKTFLLESRIVLGLGGVLIVLASVLTSLGLLSFFGVKATLIIIEVIPFLVLAVGVDNIFIIVQALQRSSNSPQLAVMSIEDRISYIIGEVGPSLLLASLSESACFLIGTLTPMPAVRVFAMTASLALLIDFILQMTVFIGLLTLDTKRQASGRYDLICCITASKSSQTSLIGSPEIEPVHHHHASSRQGLTPVTDSCNTGSPISSPNISSRSHTSDAIDAKFLYPQNSKDPFLHRMFEKHFVPFLMQDKVRYVGFVIFLGWLCLSAAVIPRIDVGLDPTMSVPDDSYMQNYFAAQKDDLRVGPPVFFVLKRGIDFSNEIERKAICSAGCDGDSMVNQIIEAYKNPNITYINVATNSWIDGYKSWGSNDKCCRMYINSNHNSLSLYRNSTSAKGLLSYDDYRYRLPQNDKFCPHNETDIDKKCTTCDLMSKNSFNSTTFYDYVDAFLKDRIRTECTSAGAGVYSNLVEIDGEKNPIEEYSLNSLIPYEGHLVSRHRSIDNDGKVTIDSAFQTFHKPLKDSKDFIEAMKAAKTLAQDIQITLNSKLRSHSPGLNTIEVFPYCFIYVFYEQYLTIWQQAIRNLAISMMTIFIVSYLLLGCDLYISIVILVTIASIVIDLMGLMYFWNVQLNAISLVNLVMAVGISVEFCSHVARAFAISKRENRVERSKEALVKMGSSVLSGITITKVAGIVVLMFAKSKIFKVYYFRMYMGIVLVGATHGIIFMPIILSLTAKNVSQTRRDDSQGQTSTSPANDRPVHQ